GVQTCALPISDASHDRDRRLVAERPAPPGQRHVTMPPRGPARETPAVAPAPGYPVPAPRGTGMRGAVVGAVVGGVLALGVVVFLSATIGAGAVAVAALLALVPL